MKTITKIVLITALMLSVFAISAAADPLENNVVGDLLGSVIKAPEEEIVSEENTTAAQPAPSDGQEITAVEGTDAESSEPENPDPAEETGTTDPDTEADTAVIPEPDNKETESDKKDNKKDNKKENAPKQSKITVEEAVASKRVVIDPAVLKEAIKGIQDNLTYPVVIDMSEFGKIDSVVFPKEILEIIIDETLDPEAEILEPVLPEEDETADVTEEEEAVQEEEPSVDTDKIAEPIILPSVSDEEIVLTIVTVTEAGEEKKLVTTSHSWKKSSIKKLATDQDTIELVLGDDDDTSTNTEEIKTESKEGVLEYKPEKDKKQHVLFVSQDEDGELQVTSDYAFASRTAYVFIIIALVILTFGVIVAVNVGIIKIYKSKK